MKILLFGKSGQVARSLVEIASHRAQLTVHPLGRHQVDLEVPGNATRAIAEAAPDLVINAAAYTAVDLAEDESARAFRINAEGAAEIATATSEIGVPVIHLSTDYVFDGLAEAPYREAAPTNPLNIYGRSKLAGEEAVASLNPRHVIVRTSWVYSPFGANFLKTMTTMAEERDEVRVVDDQRGCPTYSEDLAEALLDICERHEFTDPRTFHLAGSGDASWFEFAEMIMTERRTHGLKAAAVEPISSADWPTRAERPKYSVLDCSAIQAELGIALPPWRASVRRAIARVARSHAL